jgi:phospholipid-binding lipoprotein MlaA
MENRMRESRFRRWVGCLGLACLLALGGCATTGDSGDDPLEPANRAFHAFNDALDDNFLAPIADGYKAITPEPMRQGITNFFDNAAYPNVILNDFLQGKFLQGLEDVMRLVFNSSLGLGGFIDIATGLGLPAHDEDFGQTLGYWGMTEGAYLELPLLGPNSVRDVPDVPVSYFVSLMNFLNSSTLSFPLAALKIVNSRANLSSAIALRDKTALDPYVFTREAYRQRRRFLIYDGDPPDDAFDDLDRQKSTSFYDVPQVKPGNATGNSIGDVTGALMTESVL